MKVAPTIAATVVLLLLMAPLSFSQDNPPQQIFVGYSNLQGEGFPNRNNPSAFFDADFFRNRTTLQGVNAEWTGFPWNSVGITGDLSFNRNGRTVDLTSGSNSMHTDVYYFMAGPSIHWRNAGRVAPFARILAGGANTRFKASTRFDSPAGTVQNSFDTSSTDLAIAVGGGLDVRMGQKLKVRVVQVDFAPVFLRDRSIQVLGNSGVIEPGRLQGQRQDNVRFSFGVIF